MHRIFANLLLGLCMGFVATGAQAGIKTWTGSHSALWSDAANWTGNAVPVAGDHLVFGPVTLTVTNDMPFVVFDSLEINGGLSVSGNLIALSGSTPITAKGSVSFDAPLQLRSAGATITLSGSTNSFNAIQLSGGTFSLLASSTSTVTLAGYISETAQTSIDLRANVLNGGGSIVASGDWTFTGDTMNVGYAALGTGTTPAHIHANTLVMPTGNGDISRPLELQPPTGFMTVEMDTFGGMPTSLAGLAITGVVDFVRSVVVLGPLSGTGTLMIGDGKSGAGAWLFNTASPFSGDIHVRSSSALVTPFDSTMPASASLTIDANGQLDMRGTTTQRVASFNCAGEFFTTLGEGTLHVTSSVTVGGCSWSYFESGSIGAIPAGLTIIANEGPAAVQGAFTPEPEGYPIYIGSVAHTLTYKGGSGNDVTLLPGVGRAISFSLARYNEFTGATFPVAVKVTDANGVPIANDVVTIDCALPGCASVSTSTATTDASGIATFFAVAGPNRGGVYPINATEGQGATQTKNSADIVLYPATVLATTPRSFDLLTTDVLSGNPGETIQVPVTIADKNGPVANAPVAIEIDCVQGYACATPAAATVVTNGAGVATFNLTLGPATGQFRIILNDRSITGSVAFTVWTEVTVTPAAAQAPLTGLQDMWWAGSAENGWGMSLIQHGSTLFAALYVYDAAGNPTWLVMPGGTWNAANTICTGSVYTPGGSPFFAYDASREIVGAALGTLKLTFSDANNATLDYTINGLTGRKTITREIFASGAGTKPNHADLWWGGSAQNGWGITILQQADTLFPVWFTYDASGKATWYVMPGGAWTASDTFTGKLYRTTGSAWAGATYDATKLNVIEAGSFSLQFTGDNASFTYSADGHTGTVPLVKEPF